MSDKKNISISHQRCKGGNRDIHGLYSVIFETTSKYQIVILRLVFAKVGVDKVTRSLQEIDIRY